MSVKTGQNIIEEGLLVHVDFNNFKSNAGKITTNKRATPHTDPLAAQGTPSIINQGVKEGGWIQYGLSGQWTGGTYPYMFRIKSDTFVQNQRYSVSCEIYTDIPKSMVTGDFQLNYVNDVNMISGGSFNRNQSDIHKPMKVYRRDLEYSFSSTNQPGYFYLRGIGTPTFDPDKHHVFIRNVQVEEGTHPTPVVHKHRIKNIDVDSRGSGTEDSIRNLADSETYPVTFDASMTYSTEQASPTNGTNNFDNINRYPRSDSDTNSNVYFNYMYPSQFGYNENFAYEIWFKPDQYPNLLTTANQYGSVRKAGLLIGASSYNGHGIYWGTAESGEYLGISAFLRAPTYQMGNSFVITPPMINKWHHFMYVHDASSTYPPMVRFYVNGEHFHSFTGQTTSSTYNGTIGLSRPMVDGGGTSNYRSIDGYFGEARVYKDRLLTPEDVKRNYMATRNKYDYWRG